MKIFFVFRAAELRDIKAKLNTFSLFQTVPRMIPRSWLARCLAMTALSMAMAQENADNCPADLVSFEVITGEFTHFRYQ